MHTGLHGKIVLITGAASGIGLATARAFAAEGARLALIDISGGGLRDMVGELRANGVTVHATIADLSTREGVETGMEAALSAYEHRIDVLINNVGVCVVRAYDDVSDADWTHTWQLNFRSYERACRKVLPFMRAQRSGSIVNNASDLARHPEANFPDYAASKTSVLALTKILAQSEGPRGIRVNAVAPGPIRTPLWTRPGGLADNLAVQHGLPREEAVSHELGLRRLPLGRLGTPEEVANVIVFLASDLASFVTGSVYGVDGGSTASLCE